MNINNRNTSQEFLEALESLKQARLVTHSFMTHDHQFKGLTEAEQNGAPLPVTKIVAGYYDELSADWFGRNDTSSLIRRLRKS